MGGSISRRYVGPAGSQVHLLEGGLAAGGPPLCFLHATAYSARSLMPLLRTMVAHRRVIAVDTPGYGASDRPQRPPAISGYAEAVDRALDEAGEQAVDLFGYHTGALIAAELARIRPERVRRLILIGIPFMTGAEQEVWRAKLAEPTMLTGALSQFEDRWRFLVDQRPGGMDLHRGFECFVDELRAYPYGWWAHEAAFTFDVATCFAEVHQPVLVLNPANHLAEASRRGAAALSHGEIQELPHLENGIFDVAAQELARRIQGFLDQDPRELAPGPT